MEIISPITTLTFFDFLLPIQTKIKSKKICEKWKKSYVFEEEMWGALQDNTLWSHEENGALSLSPFLHLGNINLKLDFGLIHKFQTVWKSEEKRRFRKRIAKWNALPTEKEVVCLEGQGLRESWIFLREISKTVS